MKRMAAALMLATLARRYFSSHGPTTIRDFSWWSGLTIKDARRATETVASSLESIEVDGDDLVRGGVIGECDAAFERNEIARSAWRFESRKLCAGGEIVKGKLIASRNGSNMGGLPERIET